MPLIFQYGSLCDAEHLNSPNRLNGHAEDRGGACTVADREEDGYDIVFQHYSEVDGCAAADMFSPIPGLAVWGVLYEIPDDFTYGSKSGKEKTLLQIEGRPHYEEVPIRVRDLNGRELEARTFILDKDSWRYSAWTIAEYVGHMVKGLRAHKAPERYVEHVIEVAINYNRVASQTERWRGRQKVETKEVGKRDPQRTYTPQPGSYAVILDADGRMAVVPTRKGGYLPGGTAEPNESPEETLAREIRQAHGAEVRITRRIWQVREFLSTPRNEYVERICTFFNAQFRKTRGKAARPYPNLVWLRPYDAIRSLRYKSDGWAAHKSTAEHEIRKIKLLRTPAH